MARTRSHRRKQYCFRFSRCDGKAVVFSSASFSMSEALERLRACFPDAKEIQVVRSHYDYETTEPRIAKVVQACERVAA